MSGPYFNLYRSSSFYLQYKYYIEHTRLPVISYVGFLSSMFKLLPKDPPEITLLFLTTLDQKVSRHLCVFSVTLLLPQVVQDSTIPKKTKSLFFNTYVLKQIAQLLTTPTDHTHEDVAELQDYVYRFLLTLCTDFQLGVCYRHKEPPQGLLK